MQTILLLLGPPGSGKGTQAKLIQEKKGFVHLSTGDLLREEISKGSEFGKKAQSYIQKGQLVPDPLILDMVEDKIHSPKAQKGLILDGFPRTIPQAIALQEKLGQDQKLLAVYISVSDPVVLERIVGRRTCPKCGASYHIQYMPPKIEGKCDLCHGDLIQREDDTESVVRNRLEQYQTKTAPLISFYDQLHLLHSVDGEQDKDNLLDQILNLL